MRQRTLLAALLATASSATLASPDSSILQFQGAVHARTCDITINDQDNLTTLTLETIPVEKLRNFPTFGALTVGWLDFKLKCSSNTTRVDLFFDPGPGNAVNEFGDVTNVATVNPSEHFGLHIIREGYRWVDMRNKNSQPSNLDYDSTGGYFEAQYRLGYRKLYNTPLPQPGNFEASVIYTAQYR